MHKVDCRMYSNIQCAENSWWTRLAPEPNSAKNNQVHIIFDMPILLQVLYGICKLLGVFFKLSPTCMTWSFSSSIMRDNFFWNEAMFLAFCNLEVTE